MDLLRLEQQRQALEHNLQKLRTSLKHWQTYSAELEGLKEDVQGAAGPNLDLEAISKRCAGDVVTEKDIRDLAGLPDSPRTGPQILGLVSRRLDYVQTNIDTLQKQFFNDEAKLEELDFAAVSASRDSAGGGLPLTEIHEELDDDGNVISSSLLHPEVQTTKIVDALRKAGLSDKDLDGAGDATDPDGNDDSTAVSAIPQPLSSAMVDRKFNSFSDTKKIETQVDDDHDNDPIRSPARKKSVSFSADTKVATEPVRHESEDGRKSVSFNDKVAVMPAAPLPDPRTVTFDPKVEEIPAELAQGQETDGAIKTNVEFQKAMKGYSFKPGAKVAELNDNDDVAKFHVVIPENESEEDAATRREMLDYHLNEVGHVVAQMDLDDEDMELEEDEASDFASSEYLDEDTPYTSGLSDSEVDSEDEFGRSKSRVLNDDYHKEMRELERRLIGNLGRNPTADDVATLDPEMNPQDVRRLVVREKPDPTPAETSDSQTKSNSRKRVSFAEALNVAQEDLEPQKSIKTQQGENAAPIMEAVSERKGAAPPAAPVSRPDASSSLAGKIIADQLMERPARKKTAAAPSEDGLDPVMQRRELAAEYYRRRNDIIRQQGGFRASGEDDEEPLMEERDGKVKKVSKFKAARIKP